jgi:NAD(P)-dependent dehydrogenase (short-subunit alcohol dehydrogenase family)
MKIVMVDVNRDKMPRAETEVIAAEGGNGEAVLPMICDVSDADAMHKLAHDITNRWEAPSFLFNNAALFVSGGQGGILDALENWRRLFDVNFFGYVNGVQAFLPLMLESGRPSAIVNTGSKQGLTFPPGNPAYNTVKAAVNAYTQSLAHDLRNRGEGHVSAHLLVPGWTTTGDSEHRSGAWLPERVADYMLEKMAAGNFYIICPDDETTSEMDKKRILWQALDLIQNRPALSRWHPDYKDAFEAYMKTDLRLPD